MYVSVSFSFIWWTEGRGGRGRWGDTEEEEREEGGGTQAFVVPGCRGNRRGAAFVFRFDSADGRRKKGNFDELNLDVCVSVGRVGWVGPRSAHRQAQAYTERGFAFPPSRI